MIYYKINFLYQSWAQDTNTGGSNISLYLNHGAANSPQQAGLSLTGQLKLIQRLCQAITLVCDLKTPCPCTQTSPIFTSLVQLPFSHSHFSVSYITHIQRESTQSACTKYKRGTRIGQAAGKHFSTSPAKILLDTEKWKLMLGL